MNEVGLRASLEHLKLAVLALWHPLRQHLHLKPTTMSNATRIYLLANAALYAVVGSGFLLPLRQFKFGATGLAIVDGRLPHLVWGLSVFVVCLSQIAAILTDRWSVWMFTAVGTAMWASAYGVVVLLLSHSVGSYTGAVFWLWLLTVHFLFINNRLVPLPESVFSPQEATAVAVDQHLIEQFTQAVKDPETRP